FAKTGYLNKGYCVPYEEMAGLIRNRSVGQDAVAILDTYSSIPDPFLQRIPAEIPVILLGRNDSAERARKAANSRPVVWFWRRTHDTSPGKLVTDLEDELRQGRPHCNPRVSPLQSTRAVGIADSERATSTGICLSIVGGPLISE